MNIEWWILTNPQYHLLILVIALAVLAIAIRINRKMNVLAKKMEAIRVAGLTGLRLVAKRGVS